eukprot:COSAG01_NODE_71080_length_257_cov_0.563291_1_plen_40_part_10
MIKWENRRISEQESKSKAGASLKRSNNASDSDSAAQKSDG